MSDLGFDVDAILAAQEADDAMVDDYYLVNRADRGYDGKFMIWTKHRYLADGRGVPDQAWTRRSADEVRSVIEEITTIPVADAIASIADLRRTTDRLEFELIVYARACGWTWRDVAAAVGIDVAAAHRRYAR